MREGYNGNTVQETSGEISLHTDFSDNRELLLRAKDCQGESEDAIRATEELVMSNMGLVKKIALRFLGRGVELEDLLQIGTIGMIKAIRSFDLDRGTCFSTYAVPLIFGEIRRHMRDEGPVKVGRYYKKLGAQILFEKNRILSEEGREAHICELAMTCGVSVEEAAMALDATSPIVSLSDGAYGDEEGAELGDIIADEEDMRARERLIDRIALSEAIREMPVLWQKIVTLRYYRGMTQQEVANILCVTQVKVSREEKKILDCLRKELR
ncbi:MAG: sigma-70 family RNA polymerase sigma factor [Clostridia bacterium]|nr:sigma-70 family RNA polymerase sigma factor [Clostridia bacterium]